MATQFAVDLVFKSQTKQLNDVQRKLQQLEANLQKLNQGKPFKPIEDGAQQAGTKVGRLTKSLGGLRGALLGLGAGVALKKAFGDASALESAQTRIDNVSKKYEQLAGIQGVATQAAKTFRLSQTEALTALTDLGNRLGAQGASLEDISNIYSGFNTLLANNKVEAAQAASATLQLNQALGSGRLAGEEFNAINEATPQLLDEVAKVMQVTRGELKQLAADGKISSQVLIQALTNIRTQGAAELESAFGGAYGATKEFDAALKDFSATIGTELLPAITPLLKGATELLKLFGSLPGPVKTLVAAVAGLAGAFAVLAPVVSTIAGVLGGITAAGLLAAAPWLAVAAGVVALGKAMYDGTKKAQEFQNVLRDTSGTSTELMARMQDVRGRMAELSGEIERGGHKGRIAKERYDALKASLENLQGIYKIRLEIEEVFNGGNLGAIKSSGYGRGESGLTYTVAGVTYDARTGKPVAAPPKPFSPASSSSGGGGSKSKGDDLAKQLEESLKAGKALSREFSRQVELLKLEGETEKALLQVQFDKQDRELQIAELKSQEQQATAQLLSDELARLQTLQAMAPLVEQMNKDRLFGASYGDGDVVEQLNPNGKIGEYLKQTNDWINDTEGRIVELAGSMEGELAGAFSSIIDGSKSAQEAFADMFRGIAKSFLQMATQMIAKMIIMAILNKALGGILGSVSGHSFGGFSGGSSFGIDSSGLMGPLTPFAEGGIVRKPTAALIGEAGPEAVIPLSEMSKMNGEGGDTVVNITLNGVGGGSSTGSGPNKEEAAQLARMVEAATVGVIQRERRPGGLLAR